MAKSVQDQLQTILDQYAGQLSSTIEKTFNSVGKETKEMVKDLSPKQSGNYAEGWTMTRTKKGSASKLIGGCTVIIKNAKHYQLTHLLENGHIVKNQYGAPKKGKRRIMGQPHISKAQNWGNDKLLEELERNL